MQGGEAQKLLLPTSPGRWLLTSHRHTACVGTAAEEVLPCVCSPRRVKCSPSPSSSSAISGGVGQSDSSVLVSSAVMESFLASARRSLDAVSSGWDLLTLPGLVPPPAAAISEDDQPFYFAIDCWPAAAAASAGSQEEEGSSDRLCVIPKAVQMPFIDVMTAASAVDDLMLMLQPLAGRVHVVLIGKGDDLIRCSQGGDAATVHRDVHEQAAQLGALALTLAKRGVPHVSILDGGFGSVLRCFWNCENSKTSHKEDTDHEHDDRSDSDGSCDRTGDDDHYDADVSDRPGNGMLQDLYLSFDMLSDVDDEAIRALFLGEVSAAAGPARPAVGSRVSEGTSLLRQSGSAADTSTSTSTSKRYDEDLEEDEVDLYSRKPGGAGRPESSSSAYLASMAGMAGMAAGMFSKNMFSYNKDKE